jgi:hypothetical protein
MAKLTVDLAPFTDPEWSTTPLKPGEEVTLKTKAPKIKAGQYIEFRIWSGTDLIDAVKGEDAQQTAKWKIPNLPHQPTLKFDALLKEKPAPKNGFAAVIAKVTSGDAQVKGYSVSITKGDAAFVPQTEKIEIEYTVSDTAGAAKQGRFEIWGERYPSEKPLYTENFNPTHGLLQTWKTWDGKANAGVLSGKYITPEFSPYRVRIVIGPDQGSVDGEFVAGLAKATAAERLFEVRFQSIEVRLQAKLADAVKDSLGMRAGQVPPQIPVLAVEPRHAKGAFAVVNRLPMKTEPAVALGWAGGGEGDAAAERDGMGRIRIAGQRHMDVTDSLNQGSSGAGGDPADADGKVDLNRPGDPYMDENGKTPPGPGQTKYDIEKALYKRPEIPVELVGKLRSRDTADAVKRRDGLFSKEAVGPALFDVFAEDKYVAWLYDAGGTDPVTLYPEARAYFKKAALTVKWGTEAAPKWSGTDAVISHWQERFVIGADGQEEVGDTERAFQKTKKELTVYLNRTSLTRDDAATADNTQPVKLDYAEIGDKKIKLRKGLAMQNDVVWIIRTPEGALGYTAVDRWAAFPPGDNCHERYGGIRGVVPTNDVAGALRKDYSGGLAGGFAYTAKVNLDPDKVDAAKRERVESEAVTADGDEKGLAGAIFTPSTMGGDKYVIEGRLRERPYLRDLGWVADRPVAWDVRGRGGTMVVWRRLAITASWRMPLTTNLASGLAVGVGEVDPAPAGRTHPGTGRSMDFIKLNQQGEKAFTEWVILDKDGNVLGRDQEGHQDVPLDKYLKFFNDKAAANEAGFYNIPDDAHITNWCVRWDHYRIALPKGIPADRRNVATKAIEDLPKGSTSQQAAAAVFLAIHNWDVAHPPPSVDRPVGDLAGAAIPISNKPPANYEGWVDGQTTKFANAYMDTIMPQINAPKEMRVLRWPDMYPGWIWSNGNPVGPPADRFINLGTAGYCRGNGQAFFFSVVGNPDTFEHEMGHSLLLVHFAAGSSANFGWKHHDLTYQNCLMGYNSGAFTVPLKAVHVGADVAITTNPRAWMCPKCLMKLRGWDEILLPCHWTHPDVF